MQILKQLKLQFFAEGGASSGGGGEASASGVSAADAGQGAVEASGAARDRREKRAISGERSGISAQAPQEGDAGRAGAAAKASFDELMSDPDYKSEFDRRVQGIVRSRLGSDRSRELMSKAAPMFQRLAVKYGVDANDIDGITRKVMADPSIYEAKADALGVDIDTAKGIVDRELELEALKAEREGRLRRDEVTRHLQRLREESREVLAMNPDFDLDAEIRSNPAFARYTSPQIGMPAADAYFATHRREILAERQEQTVQMVSDSIRAGQSRPRENGATAAASTVTAQKYSEMPPERRAEIKRQMRLSAARGERFTPDRW